MAMADVITIIAHGIAPRFVVEPYSARRFENYGMTGRREVTTQTQENRA